MATLGHPAVLARAQRLVRLVAPQEVYGTAISKTRPSPGIPGILDAGGTEGVTSGRIQPLAALCRLDLIVQEEREEMLASDLQGLRLATLSRLGAISRGLF